jgi:hypothetical protein
LSKNAKILEKLTNFNKSQEIWQILKKSQKRRILGGFLGVKKGLKNPQKSGFFTKSEVRALLGNLRNLEIWGRKCKGGPLVCSINFANFQNFPVGLGPRK